MIFQVKAGTLPSIGLSTVCGSWPQFSCRFPTGPRLHRPRRQPQDCPRSSPSRRQRRSAGRRSQPPSRTRPAHCSKKRRQRGRPPPRRHLRRTSTRCPRSPPARPRPRTTNRRPRRPGKAAHIPPERRQARRPHATVAHQPRLSLGATRTHTCGKPPQHAASPAQTCTNPAARLRDGVWPPTGVKV